MKPHIKKIEQVWQCCTEDAMGCGETPFVAYFDWECWKMRVDFSSELGRILQEPLVQEKREWCKWLF